LFPDGLARQDRELGVGSGELGAASKFTINYP
jgi:hypothetical protein